MRLVYGFAQSGGDNNLQRLGASEDDEYYGNIPIVSTPLSLRNLLEEKDIPYTEDKLVKLYTRNKVKEGWFL